MTASCVLRYGAGWIVPWWRKSALAKRPRVLLLENAHCRVRKLRVCGLRARVPGTCMHECHERASDALVAYFQPFHAVDNVSPATVRAQRSLFCNPGCCSIDRRQEPRSLNTRRPASPNEEVRQDERHPTAQVARRFLRAGPRRRLRVRRHRLSESVA
eukprot:scaffold13877_cov60-Phaeocystis_antarctica.AAC.1